MKISGSDDSLSFNGELVNRLAIIAAVSGRIFELMGRGSREPYGLMKRMTSEKFAICESFIERLRNIPVGQRKCLNPRESNLLL